MIKNKKIFKLKKMNNNKLMKIRKFKRNKRMINNQNNNYNKNK